MPNIRRTFIKGVMNKDVDERLLDDGFFRHAENIIINTSEGNNVGAIEKCLSNKKLTSIGFAEDVETLGTYVDNAKSKLYWWVTTNNSCLVFEYDFNSKVLYTLLEDDRKEEDRVLNLKRENLITGIVKIVSETPGKDLLLWTDNNMEICCINIERSKKYGKNGFDKEDIYLIKKPPISAPRIVLTFDDNFSNNIEDKFVAFAYRYKYLDGEYSAISAFSNYAFEPLGLKLDFDTNDNSGMINRYNAVMVYFNTGDKRVKEVQVLAKESNSNSVYIVETFDKEKESWDNFQEKSIIYSNNKLYKVLPEIDFFKQFDNVPKRAKALTAVSNRLVLGNYTEGYDLVDDEGKVINIDYKVELVSNKVNRVQGINYYLYYSYLLFYFRDYKKDNVINFSIEFQEEANKEVGFSFIGNLDFVLNKDVFDVLSLKNDDSFIQFINEYNRLIKQDLKFAERNGKDVEIIKYPEIVINTENANIRLELRNVEFRLDNTTYSYSLVFSSNTVVYSYATAKGRTLKSNRDYEVAIVYEDEFKRASTALTCINNTVFVPHSESDSINKIKATINNKAPYWANTYRLAVKSNILTYDTFIVTRFYSEEGFTWCKIEGNSKDKVKEGEFLILKKDTIKILQDIIYVEVLEKKEQPSDFIKGNKDSRGNDIIEEAGTYIKIKPNGFTMSSNDFQIFQDEKSDSRKTRGRYPDVLLDLFYDQKDKKSLDLPIGSSVYLWISSVNHLDKGRQENTLELTWNINLEGYNIDRWYSDHIENKNLWGNKGNSSENYKGKIRKSGVKLFIEGTKSASSGGRHGYIDAKIVIRINNGYYVFETKPKKDIDTGLFYMSPDSYKIKDGNHLADINQDNKQDIPAVINSIDFFNAYCLGEGIESYKIKDQFNSNSLNIHLSPTATSTEEYAEVIRYSDLTYGAAFVESTGINGLNSFNMALLNWKELDKQNGSIQKIVGREGNLLVFQKDKIGQVLYGKDMLYNADGTSNVAKVPYILGEYIPYAGEFGMSHPESFEQDGNRVYWVDAKRGNVLRLSINGISPITYGMEGWFKKILNEYYGAKIVGGIDPYNDMYNITIGDKPNLPVVVDCGFVLNMYKQNTPFIYEFKLNDLTGDAIINFNIYEGAATIECIYKGFNYVKSNIQGPDYILIPIPEISNDRILVKITPIGGEVSFDISHSCPIGKELRVRQIILADKTLLNKNTTSGYKWGNSSLFKNNNLFSQEEVIIDTEQVGTEGLGMFPKNNSEISVFSMQDASNNVVFNPKWNRIGYLISPPLTHSANEIADLSTKLEVVKESNVYYPSYKGKFEFDRTSIHDQMYIIWDYRYIGGEVDRPIISSIEFNNVWEFLINQTLEAAYISTLEIESKEMNSDTWNKQEVLLPLDISVNQRITFDYFDVEKDYLVRFRFKTHHNELSEWTQSLVESNYKIIKAPSELTYEKIGGGTTVNITYKSDLDQLLLVTHSEILIKEEDNQKWSDIIINKVFDSNGIQKHTFENLNKYKNYDVKVRFVTKNNTSEWSSILIEEIEHPDVPNTEIE
ncbi:fibronectin type III domain-containing protein [Myroides odoratimimus]|uniref:fibronectin type III domain-containing protein n=1 Tax=Myroides odoratimimus TaxID=76832 RepID=UPI002578ADFE|nr:fibronectin type III domain-containing protein [Myroides odoratimimus]MDM1494989.1 fibronectin type III domain-containing protein [Myroides odoratimimus]